MNVIIHLFSHSSLSQVFTIIRDLGYSIMPLATSGSYFDERVGTAEIMLAFTITGHYVYPAGYEDASVVRSKFSFCLTEHRIEYHSIIVNGANKLAWIGSNSIKIKKNKRISVPYLRLLPNLNAIAPPKESNV